MQKYKKVAINIAFLTMILSAGVMNNYSSNLDQDFDSDFNINSKKSSEYSQEKQEKILNSFENNDYLGWKKIIGQNNKVANIIDESTFKNFVAARVAARSGQYDVAIQITEELKIKVKDKLI